ncbi:MAG: HAD-IC family P-type ATPase, partial [Solobacterium sp.]|nr:HAD-IC family P-type ATPase [Solobacterium sp.]
QDELRTNINQMTEYLQSQSVIIKVISGDDPAAVSSIAAAAGIKDAQKYTDLSKRTESYDVLAAEYTVFGRVMPADKKELVDALQKKGYHCAMTGDGVNDVPALKKADTGVSMGDASMAARDSSSLIILDNDFAKMPDIINEGRRVINNITHAASMFLVKTLFSFLLAVYVIFTLRAYPIVPVQLTAVSMCMVGIPAFLLQFEPDFRKSSGSFLFSAFFNSIPSAVTAVLVCINVSLLTGTVLDEPRAAAVRVILLGFIYFLTLLRTYYPWTTYRLGIILSMGALFTLIILLVPSLIYIHTDASIIRYLLYGAAAVPVMIFVFSKLFMLVYRKYRKYRYGT